MPKLVRLKWTDDIHENEEIVLLLSEDDEVLVKDGKDTPTGIIIADLIDETGHVLFEDENGVFGLEPDQVISIDPVDSSES